MANIALIWTPLPRGHRLCVGESGLCEDCGSPFWTIPVSSTVYTTVWWALLWGSGHPQGLRVLSCPSGAETRRWARPGPLCSLECPPGGRDRCDATGNGESGGEAVLLGPVQEGFLEEADGERPRWSSRSRGTSHARRKSAPGRGLAPAGPGHGRCLAPGGERGAPGRGPGRWELPGAVTQALSAPARSADARPGGGHVITRSQVRRWRQEEAGPQPGTTELGSGRAGHEPGDPAVESTLPGRGERGPRAPPSAPALHLDQSSPRPRAGSWFLRPWFP